VTPICLTHTLQHPTSKVQRCVHNGHHRYQSKHLCCHTRWQEQSIWQWHKLGNIARKLQ